MNFILETDTSGTFVASSLGFASAHWAKLSQLLVNGGHWNNRQLLSNTRLGIDTSSTQCGAVWWEYMAQSNLCERRESSGSTPLS